jgi:erythromycin esterase-like protein
MEANEEMGSDLKRAGRELPAAAFDTTDWQRDLLSGANAILYAELHPTRKIALWAHGFHLNKNDATGRKGASDIGTMGTILNAHLAEGGHPDAYCCGTFTTASGTVTALKATEVVAAMGDGTVSGRYAPWELPAQRDGALEAEVRRALGDSDWVMDLAKATGGVFDASVDMACVGSELDLEDPLGNIMRCEPAKAFDLIVVLGKTSSTPFLPKFDRPE